MRLLRLRGVGDAFGGRIQGKWGHFRTGSEEACEKLVPLCLWGRIEAGAAPQVIWQSELQNAARNSNGVRYLKGSYQVE